MGAKFLSSLANLFMSEWVDKSVFGIKRDERLFYKRLSDDLFFIWVGTEMLGTEMLLQEFLN